MSDAVYMTSAKGGAGATTCAVRTGLALALRGERTLIVDGDARCGNGLTVAGVAELCSYTLEDAQRGACRVKQALINHPLSPNLYILPTLGCNDGRFTEEAVKSCSGQFDRLICDGAAMGACKRAVVISEPYSTSVKSAKRTAAYLKDVGFKTVGLIANKVNGGLVFDGAIPTPQELAELTRCELVGVIPEDLLIAYGKIKKSTKKAFAYTAELLLGGNKIYDVIKGYSGVKGAIKRKMRELV